MNDMTKIMIGLVAFLLIVFFPLWYNVAMDRADYVPELAKPVKGDQCVRDKDWMTTNHMDLLDVWRDEVVRDGIRYEDFNGQRIEKSLSNTCMDCHANKSEFCDRCHNYLAVDPFCWDCHIEPEETM